MANVKSKGHKLNLDPYITTLTVLIRTLNIRDKSQIETKSNLDSARVVNFFADSTTKKRQRQKKELKERSFLKGTRFTQLFLKLASNDLLNAIIHVVQMQFTIFQ